MRIIIKLTICFLLLSFLSFSQSQLIFQNIKDSTNIYQLPLGKFPVQLKLKDTVEFKAILDSYTDSVLHMRVYTKSRAIDSAISILYRENFALIKTKHKKKDSLNSELNKKINLTRYAIGRTVAVSKINMITVYNHYYPASNKKIKLVNAACAVFIATTLFVSPTKNPYLIGSGVGLTAVAFIVKSAISTKNLDLTVSRRAKFKKKWKLVRMQD